MKNNPRICAMLVAITCLAGTAAAQEFNDRRGPNVMPAPARSVENYPNNTNSYNRNEMPSRRGPNVMQTPESYAQASPAPRANRAPGPVEHGAQRSPGTPDTQDTPRARGTGPNIEGEAITMPSESPGSGRSGRHGDAIPGCDKCVAI
jgi:hypothetical protein